MGNGNDPPACIPYLEISDEKHDFTKQWPNNQLAWPIIKKKNLASTLEDSSRHMVKQKLFIAGYWNSHSAAAV